MLRRFVNGWKTSLCRQGPELIRDITDMRGPKIICAAYARAETHVWRTCAAHARDSTLLTGRLDLLGLELPKVHQDKLSGKDESSIEDLQKRRG